MLAALPADMHGQSGMFVFHAADSQDCCQSGPLAPGLLEFEELSGPC